MFHAPTEIPRVRPEIPVYFTGPGDRPGVIVMHEAGGMSPACLDLARDLASDWNLRVYLPLIFGRPNQERRSQVDLRGLFCIRREMHLFASDVTSPVTGLIRQLVSEVAVRTGVARVGVIGMCLTGGLVLGLMAQPEVAAAVASQPSLPLVAGRLSPRYKRATLGLAASDLAESVRSRTPLLALRFEGDGLCPVERMSALEDAFEGRGTLTVHTVPGDGHSVLTADRRPNTPEDRVPLVGEFLTSHLDPPES
jgi:dienelactone hydrolase